MNMQPTEKTELKQLSANFSAFLWLSFNLVIKSFYVFNKRFNLVLLLIDQVVGNLISSLILKREKLLESNLTLINLINESVTFEKDYSYCGVNGCPNIKSGEASLPPNIITVKKKRTFSLIFIFYFQ